MRKIVVCVAATMLSFQASAEPKTEAVLVGDAEDLPPLLVHVTPGYPKNAARGGVDGFCKVEFDIGHDDGRVKNLKIVECEPTAKFEKSCITALNKWWFRPPSSMKGEVTANSVDAICRYRSSAPDL